MADPPTPPPPLGDDRLTTVGLLFEVAASLGALLRPQLADHGLAPTEFEVLLRLGRSPDGQLRMTDLAQQANLSASGLTRLVDRLVTRGLVVRRTCPTDGRGLNAQISPAGRTLLDQVLPGHLALVGQWFTSALSPAQGRALTEALHVVRDRVHPGAVAGAHPGRP